MKSTFVLRLSAQAGSKVTIGAWRARWAGCPVHLWFTQSALGRPKTQWKTLVVPLRDPFYVSANYRVGFVVDIATGVSLQVTTYF